MIDRFWTNIYIMTMPRGLKKVGLSDNPSKRRDYLQGANPHEIKVVFVRRIPRSVARWIEAEAHAALGRKHVRGEWFAASLHEAHWAIITAIQNSGAELAKRQRWERPLIEQRARVRRALAADSPP